MLGLAQGKSIVYGFFFQEPFSLGCLVVWLVRPNRLSSGTENLVNK